MPINAICGDGDLRHQVGARECNAVTGKAAQRNAADHSIFNCDIAVVQEHAERIGLCICGHRCRQPYPKARRSSTLNSTHSARPCTLTPMQVVKLRRRTVETDLHGDPIAWQGPKAIQPPAYEQHPISEYGCGRCRGARQEYLADTGEKERLAAGNEDVPDPQLGCFLCDLLYALKAERPPRRLWRGAYATIVAAQVAIEIGVEPQARPNGTIGFAYRWGFAAADHPARLICLLGRLDQGVPGKATPSCEVIAQPGIAANNSEEIPGATAAQRVDQIWEQPRRESF